MKLLVPRHRLRVVLPVLATVAIVAPLSLMWQTSRMPAVYSVMDMGDLDYGGGPEPDRSVAGHSHHESGHQVAQSQSITDLVVDPDRPADVRVDLVTRQQQLTVGGRSIAGYTVNGTSPGPEIRATQGELVEVRLRNESVAAGVTLHWHGLDVPNAMDGVAGVTQDAVPVGGQFVYRFVADQVGSFWYHSHQVSNPQVAGGLLGSLVVTPKSGIAQQLDVSATAHTYSGVRTINGKAEDLRVPARPGQLVRIRVTNTDNGPIQIWSNGSYRLLAVDGVDVHQPPEASGRSLTLTSGGRADLEIKAPSEGSAARVQLSKAVAVIIGPTDANPAVPTQPTEELDLLTYGEPAPLGLDPASATRRFDYLIGRRPGFVRGRPGMWWSINGHIYPNVPMFVVREGDVALVHIENHGGEVHPMHLHGHHMVVLARNGMRATGSPWWVDSLNVAANESYDVAFLADNPGIWMDHCHNLKHAAQGMVAHLMYEGLDTPYRIAGVADNRPE
jgi:FtsP/CotA-like multicopper oxidase with cupredoxin domain